jgi:hypothetical protein
MDPRNDLPPEARQALARKCRAFAEQLERCGAVASQFANMAEAGAPVASLTPYVERLGVELERLQGLHPFADQAAPYIEPPS